MERRSGFKLSKLIFWWDNVERSITRLLLLLLVLMVIMQGIYQNQSLKAFFNPTQKLEGKSVENIKPSVIKGNIELTIQGSSYAGDIDIYVNGERVTSFYKDKVLLNVRNSDVIEISGVRSENTAMIQVTDSSENVVTPELGRTLTINGNLANLCRVKLNNN